MCTRDFLDQDHGIVTPIGRVAAQMVQRKYRAGCGPIRYTTKDRMALRTSILCAMMWQPSRRKACDMFCPKCETKYPWHVMVCPDCDVDTVDRLPGPEPLPDVELVCAYTTRDTALISLARSVLDDEQIDYFVKGDGLQDLFGLGRNAGFSEAMRAAEFWVRADDAERVRDLIEGLSASGRPRQASDREES